MPIVTPLQDPADLEAAIEESLERPVLIFKHSRSCGTSCEALDELHAHVQRAPGAATYKLITVQSHRAVSDQVTARLGIRHETPQAILLREGRVVWSASHSRITAAALARQPLS